MDKKNDKKKKSGDDILEIILGYLTINQEILQSILSAVDLSFSHSTIVLS